MAKVKVFISYRRDTDAPRATLIAKAIEGGQREGGFLDAVHGVDVEMYMDVRDRLGAKWPARIREELAAVDIVVVVIGPDWLSAADAYHRRRIDQEEDWVRQEIELALTTENVVVVPMLFDGAEMPPGSALPSSVAPLAERQGLPVRTTSFESDIQPLLRELLARGTSHENSDYARSQGEYSDTRWPYPDPPLVVKPAQLSDQDIELALSKMIPAWTRCESPLPHEPSKVRVELHRTLRFRSFADALTFMVEVGRFCDEANHHPRWENVYRTLWIYLSTWDIGHRVSHLDLILASQIDRAFQRYLKV